MKRRKVLLAFLVFLGMAAALLVPTAWRYYEKLALLVNPAPEKRTTLIESEEDYVPPEPPPPATFLVFGIDTGEWVGGSVRPGRGRADTIILLRIDFAAQKAALFSIPRDTLLVIPGRSGTDKVGHAYAFGGDQLLKETVELFTGVQVDYYVRVNYLAFKDMVDALGGLEFDLDRRIAARGLVLEAGPQLLDGDAAFAVVSFRYEPMGDIARVRRQQRFVLSLCRTAAQQSAFKIFPLARAFFKHTKTNLSLEQAADFALHLRGMKTEDITTEIVPGWFYERRGISYWKPDPVKMADILEELFFQSEPGEEDLTAAAH